MTECAHAECAPRSAPRLERIRRERAGRAVRDRVAG